MISIKVDIESHEIKNDPTSKWGYWGSKSKEEAMNIELLMELMAKRGNMGIHECLTGEKYRPYADVDAGEKEGITAENFKVKRYEILKAARDVMRKTFPLAEFHLFDRSGQKPDGSWKVSGHLIGNNIYYTDKEHIRYLLEQAEGTDYFDFQVYDSNHLFFVPNCTKPGDKRRLRYAEISTIGDISGVFPEKCPNRKCKKCAKFEDCANMDEGTIACGLITLIDADEKEMPVPKGFKPVEKEKKFVQDFDTELTDEQKQAQLEKVTKLIAALSPSRASGRDGWCKGVWALRRIGQKSGQLGAYQKLAHVFAKKTDKDNYSEVDTDNLYMAEPKEVGVGFATLKKWADEDTPDWDLNFDIKAGDEFDIELIKAKAKPKMTVQEFNSFKDASVEYMNKFYTLIKWGRKPFIVYETWKVNKNGEREKERDYKDVYSIKIDFANKAVSITIGKDEKATVICPFKCWLQHPKRNEKERMYFNPKAFLAPKYADPKAYNVFDGLAIQHKDCKDAPALTKDSPWLQHVLKRWCKGDETQYNNILDRFALQIQRPWVKHMAGLGLMSPDGSGKGLVLQPVFRIIGSKYVADPNESSQILGKFNSLMEGKLIVFLDELVWGGDKEREGALKRLVTEENGSIERKGIDPVPVDNPANVICCSNEDWMLPAGKKARRFQVHELDDELAGSQTAKTEKIIEDILSVDILSIAKFFYERDISGFNPKKILATDGLRSQKIASMSPLDQACFKIVNSGVVKINGHEHFITEGEFQKSEFYEAVGEPIKFMNDVKFWIQVRKLWPSIVFDRKTVGKKKTNFVTFPKLEIMRQEFSKMYDDEGWKFDDADEEAGDDE